MNELVIFGSHGFGREVLQLVKDINRLAPHWRVLGFLDDDSAKHGAVVNGLPVLGSFDYLVQKPHVFVAVAISNPAAKRKVVSRIKAFGLVRFATLIHPQTTIGETVTLGEGVIVCAGARLITDIKIGSHVIINLNCTIGYDSVIENYASLAPNVNLSRKTRIGEGSELGTNSLTLPEVALGDWSLLGAGAVLRDSTRPNVVAAGVPAVVIREQPEGWQDDRKLVGEIPIPGFPVGSLREAEI